MQDIFGTVKEKNIPFRGDGEAFNAFVARVTRGKYEGKVEFVQVPSESGFDEYELSAKGGKVAIKATSGTAAGSALNAYLTSYCGYYFGLMTSTGSLPETPPDTAGALTERSAFHYRYAFNYCTYGYTYAFHDWEQWERVTDYLILSGYNLVLNPIANECVWLELLQRFGYTYEEAKKYLSAPNYLPWQWMMNISAFESEYFEEWFEEQREIAVRFNEKLAQFGMAPVVPGYCGALPDDFGERYPDAKIFKQGLWSNFLRPAILSSDDPLFARIAESYYAIQREIFKTESLRYYSVDPFHEGGDTKGVNLQKFARDTLACMKKDNENAVWLLQGWQENPNRTLLTALDKKDVLIVNLHADLSPIGGDDFCGYAHIYCVVNNFGGQQILRGSAEKTYTLPVSLANDPNNACVGLGTIPEGVECDEYLFDILSYLSVKSRLRLSFEEFVRAYFAVRYQKNYEDLAAVWTELFREICKEDIVGCTRESSLCCRPSLTVKKVSTWAGNAFEREDDTLRKACKIFYSRYEELKDNECFVKDFVMILRQTLADYGWKCVFDISKAYGAGDLTALSKAWEEFSSLYDLQAEVVDCDKTLNLQAYIDNATKRGKTPEQKAWLERVAKELVTLWGDEKGSVPLHDYAAREYGDMLRYFYKPRWKKFVDTLIESLKTGKEAEEIDWYAFEYAFVKESKTYAAGEGDLKAAAQKTLAFLDARQRNKGFTFA